MKRKNTKRKCGRAIKLAITFALAVLTAFSTLSLVGCKKGGSGGESSATLADVDIWSTYATELVWRDVGEYDKVKFPANISLEAVGGETESAQIIMTTGNKAVDAYDVTVTDLYAGEEKFDKSNIAVYCEKYINVAATEYYTYNGYCPDALAPFAGVKAAKENVIAKNSNQGLYISFKVPENQKAGEYSGALTVTIGGESKTVPVSLTVARASIGVENHSKSSFSVKWGHGRGELDTTEDMTDKYIDFLMEYRLGANHILNSTAGTDKEISLWAKKACALAKNPKCVSYGIPYNSVNIKSFEITYSDGRKCKIEKEEAFAVYDEQNLEKYFTAFFYEGLKQNIDPFEKAFFKGVDEPFMWYQDDAVIMIDSYIVKRCKDKAIAAVSADASIENRELLGKMIESLRALPHVITEKTAPTMYSKDPSVDPYGFDPEVMDLVMCPYFNVLNGESDREAFRLFESNELWWYGCNTPTAPFPTYHLGNTLLSPRLCSWMQAQYGIVGNLYWACDYYRGANDDGSNWLEDYYEGDGMRNSNTFGEGFIMYPGKKYGVDGPLSSLRLEAVRDGLEEYEMIYKLKEFYGEKGYSEDEVMNLLYETMYGGSRINTDITGGVFASAREKLIDYLELASSSANVMIADIGTSRDKAVFDIYCADGHTLDISDGANVTAKDVTGGKLYTARVTYGGAKFFEIKTEIDGEKYSASFPMYESAVFVGAESLKDAVNKDSHSLGCDLSVSLVSAADLNPEETEQKYLKLSLGASAASGTESSGREQRVRIEGDLLTNNITNSTVKVVIEVFSSYDEDISATLYYKGSKATSLVTPADTVSLKKGINTLVFDLSGDIRERMGKLSYLMLSFGNKGDAARDGLYIVGMTAYGN